MEKSPIQLLFRMRKRDKQILPYCNIICIRPEPDNTKRVKIFNKAIVRDIKDRMGERYKF